METITFTSWLMEGNVFDAECGSFSGTGRTRKTAVQRLLKTAKANLNAVNPKAAEQAGNCVAICKDWLKTEGTTPQANLNVWGEAAWGRNN